MYPEWDGTGEDGKMGENVEMWLTVASMVLAVLAAGMVVVWLAGRLGRALERPARWLGRFWYPGGEDEETEDGDEA